MESLLAAYRVGARVAWRRTAAAGREAGFDAETLSLLAEGFFAFIDELSARSAAGFVEERSAAAGETARRRRALVALLAQSPPADAAALEAAAREAGWELPRRLAALVWRDDSEQPVGRRLPAGTLVAGTEDGIPCALVPDAAAPGRQAEIERAVRGHDGGAGPHGAGRRGVAQPAPRDGGAAAVGRRGRAGAGRGAAGRRRSCTPTTRSCGSSPSAGWRRWPAAPIAPARG